MAEVFGNKVRTTVAAPYVAASGTLEVASATGMPATGNFRVRLGNVAGSILRVTARTGTTLTVDVEQDDGDAIVGDTVRLVNTAAAMEALKADAIAGGGGGMPWWPTLVPVVPADFAWINQGTASEVFANDIAYLNCPLQTQNIRARGKTMPATPFTITALVFPNLSNVASGEVGIGFRKSSTDIWVLLRRDNAGGVFVTNYLAANNISTNQITGPLAGAAHAWLRIRNDGTNLIYSVSFDGRNFRQLLSQAKTLHFTDTPNQVVYFANDRSNAQAAAITVASWEETA